MNIRNSYRQWNQARDTISSLKSSSGLDAESENYWHLLQRILILTEIRLVLQRPIIGPKGRMLLLSLKQEIKDFVDRHYGMPENERLFPIVQEAVQHKMKRQMEKAGVKKIRVHDLRHSHVAYLINKGVEPILIKERVGHKDIRITLNTYGHLYPNQQRKVADLLDTEKEKSPNSGNC